MTLRPPLRVARALIGLDYPVTRGGLIAHVRRHGAQPQVLAMLEPLPDRSFEDEQDLATELQDAP